MMDGKKIDILDKELDIYRIPDHIAYPVPILIIAAGIYQPTVNGFTDDKLKMGRSITLALSIPEPKIIDLTQKKVQKIEGKKEEIVKIEGKKEEKNEGKKEENNEVKGDNEKKNRWTEISSRLSCKPCDNFYCLYYTDPLSAHGRGIKMQTCSRCHTVRYCGKECQRAHWSTHKSFCNKDGLSDDIIDLRLQHLRKIIRENVKGVKGSYAELTVDDLYPNNQMVEIDSKIVIDNIRILGDDYQSSCKILSQSATGAFYMHNLEKGFVLLLRYTPKRQRTEIITIWFSCLE
jgi:hypothetical protein